MSAREPEELDDVVLPPRSGVALRVTPASAIAPRRVSWLWEGSDYSGWIAEGSFGLLGGRESLGKTFVSIDIMAKLTRGRLPGTRWGRPSSCLMSASEDSWASTIVPRLMAADADLGRVFRVDARTVLDGDGAAIEVPRDVAEVERLIQETDAALVVLDPLMSRLSASLDTHRDGQVRQGLEPLVAVAERTRCAFLGLIHVNKSSSDDALTLLMGSRAFAAVARGVLFVAVDPNDEARRILGQPKNNLGAKQSEQTYTIERREVAPDHYSGRVAWGGASETTIIDALRASAGSADERLAGSEAVDWLRGYLEDCGGSAPRAEIAKAARAAGPFSDAQLRKARVRLKLSTQDLPTTPRTTLWRLPVVSVDLDPHTTSTTSTTSTTAENRGVFTPPAVPDLQSCQSRAVLGNGDTTGASGFAFDGNPTGPAVEEAAPSAAPVLKGGGHVERF